MIATKPRNHFMEWLNILEKTQAIHETTGRERIDVTCPTCGHEKAWVHHLPTRGVTATCPKCKDGVML